MRKYIIDSNIFDYLILLDPAQLCRLVNFWEFYTVSNIKNYQLKGLRDKARWNAEKIDEIFKILNIETLPNKNFPWMEDDPWWPSMFPFDNNTSSTFIDLKWNTTGQGDLHDALIGDATNRAGGVLLTNDKGLTKRAQREAIPVLSWQDFLDCIGDL